MAMPDLRGQYYNLPGVLMGSFAATGSVIHVISPPESGRAER
jgi:hypothetical protein